MFQPLFLVGSPHSATTSPDAEVVHTGFYRPNLDLAVLNADTAAAKNAQVLKLLSRQDGDGIVYTATVKTVDELVVLVRGQGMEVEGYHGRMALKQRTKIQDRFMSGALRTLVATNAFGLGIDKPEIRFVIHYHVPGTMEAYYQEFGRAGRAGQSAQCTLLYAPEDRRIQQFFQGSHYTSEEDLVNAYHSLERTADTAQLPTYQELNAIAPLSSSRLRSCLAILMGKGIVRREARNRYRLLVRGLTHDELARAGESHRARRENDRLKLQQIVDYAEGHGCRWKAVLDYFGSEEKTPGNRCGHCDHCAPERFAR